MQFCQVKLQSCLRISVISIDETISPSFPVFLLPSCGHKFEMRRRDVSGDGIKAQ